MGLDTSVVSCGFTVVMVKRNPHQRCGEPGSHTKGDVVGPHTSVMKWLPPDTHTRDKEVVRSKGRSGYVGPESMIRRKKQNSLRYYISKN